MSSSRRRHEAEDKFYPLDNSAVFMAAIAGASGPFVFRLSCELDETIRLPSLEAALQALAPRYPYLFVTLRSGVFWHYLDPAEDPPGVEAEASSPAGPMRRGGRRPLVRVTAYGRRVACEFHHAVTDGTGAATFLRSLLVEYFVRRGAASDLKDEELAGIPRPGQEVDPEEEEDAYERFFRPEATVPDKAPPAFRIGGGRLRAGYRETVGTISLGSVLSLARERKASITEFLAAVHLATLQEMRGDETRPRRGGRKTIALQIPINLRKIYPSRSLRNFFLFAVASIDLRLGQWSFEEILRRVHHQLRIGMEEKELLRQLKRNVGGERNPLGRPVFLPVKNLVLRAINAAIGVGTYSGSISNLGPIELPPSIARHVLRFSFLPSRARATGANIGVVSWGDRLFVTVGSVAVERDFERRFFSALVAFGLDVTVESSEGWTGPPARLSREGLST